MTKIKTIEKANVKGKRVLVRVDYNVPTKNGKVADSERLESSAKTVKWLSDSGAIVVLCSHFGRPDGKKNKEFSLKFLVNDLKEILDRDVLFVPDCIGIKKDQAIKSAKPGDVILLENVRFYPEEETNDAEFSKNLASGCDLFVNDAFSASHRAHASVVGVANILPSFAGFALSDEVKNLNSLLKKPHRPYIIVSAGAKISDKIDILKGLIPKADVLIIGGAMANTFLAAEGYDVGKSVYEPDYETSADEIKRECEDNGVELMLPDDVVCAKSVSNLSKTAIRPIDEVDKSDIIVDIGPNSIAKYAEPLKFAGTIFWNGPVGISEHKNSAKGTIGIAKIISESRAVSVIGGGDTLSAVKDLGLKFSFVSTGGGSTLEYLSGKKLPGIEVLKI